VEVELLVLRSGAARDGSPGLRQTALVSVPETVYAKASGGWLGYQVVGTGRPDVLATKTFLPVDLMWDEPRFVRFLNGLSSTDVVCRPPGGFTELEPQRRLQPRRYRIVLSLETARCSERQWVDSHGYVCDSDFCSASGWEMGRPALVLVATRRARTIRSRP